MEWYKALTETRTSLGLSKKVDSTYKDKTADDVVKETSLMTRDGFLRELKRYALTECKMSPKNIEVKVYSNWKELYFYFGSNKHDLIVFFPTEVDSYFGICAYNREGKETVSSLGGLSGSIETSSLNHYLPVSIIYETSPMNLEVMERFIERSFSIYGQYR